MLTCWFLSSLCLISSPSFRSDTRDGSYLNIYLTSGYAQLVLFDIVTWCPYMCEIHSMRYMWQVGRSLPLFLHVNVDIPNTWYVHVRYPHLYCTLQMVANVADVVMLLCVLHASTWWYGNRWHMRVGCQACGWRVSLTLSLEIDLEHTYACYHACWYVFGCVLLLFLSFIFCYFHGWA